MVKSIKMACFVDLINKSGLMDHQKNYVIECAKKCLVIKGGV